MEQNQIVNKKREHTEKSSECLAEMKKQLARREAFWKKTCDEVNRPLRRASQLSKQPEKDLSDLILTPNQAEGLAQLQRLCFGMDKLRQQFNTVVVTHELDLPPLLLVELSDELLRMDNMITNAKAAAGSLGIAAVQPKVKRDYLDKFLGFAKKVMGNGTATTNRKSANGREAAL